MPAPFSTYDVGSGGGNREDLLGAVFNIDPVETPMFSRFGRAQAKNTLHEWMADTLSAASTNAVVEGSDATYGDLVARTRSANYTHILRKTYQITDTQEVVDKAGVNSEIAYQADKAAKELMRDIEFELIRSTSASGSESVARSMVGLDTALTTNTADASAAALSGLENSTFNGLLEDCWDNGGRPNAIYVNGFNKRQISQFTAGNTKNVNIAEGTLFRSVDIYDSDFGRLEVILERHMLQSVVYVLEEARFRVAMLRPTKITPLAKTGSAHNEMIEAELTLEFLAEKSSGKITNTSTS